LAGGAVAAGLLGAWLWRIDVPGEPLVRMNGVVFGYDSRTDRLEARVDESDDTGDVAIPDWNGRPGDLLRTRKGQRFPGSREPIRPWAVSDVVVLHAGTAVSFSAAKWPPGPLHLRVGRADYAGETQAYFADRGIALWTGDVAISRR